MNQWPERDRLSTVENMDPDRDHFASITTPRGSVVSIPFLTEEQAAVVADQYGPPAEPIAPIEAGKGETRPCGRCSGMGYWYENVEIETPSGGKVSTQKRVNCRPCGGTGQIPK